MKANEEAPISGAKPPSRYTQYYRYLALCSHIALLVWVGLWQGILSPHEHINVWWLTVIWCLPLCLPLKGMMAGKPYTHAWANFILMLYFLHALTTLYCYPNEVYLVAVELCLASLSFVGNTCFARAKGRELGQALPRLSQVEKNEREQFYSN